MGAEYIKENEKILKKATGDSEVDPTDIYSAHFLGPYGAAKFNAALKTNPQTYAHNLLPTAAGSNKSIFYEDNGAGRPRTVGEIRAVLEQKVKTKAESFGIKLKILQLQQIDKLLVHLNCSKPVNSTPVRLELRLRASLLSE
jgi:hypothetical protein